MDAIAYGVSIIVGVIRVVVIVIVVVRVVVVVVVSTIFHAGEGCVNGRRAN